MKQELFFDIETTGLPPKNSDWKVDFMRFPHIASISWINTLGRMRNYIIKPNGYEIPIEATNIHGITNEQALKEGFKLDSVLMKFYYDAIGATIIVGHNMYFDTSIIKANVLRGKVFPIEAFNKALDKSKRIDTMFRTIKFVNAKFKDGRGGKWPTLIELYAKLFNEEFDAHNSKDDVLATKRCYEELIKLKII